MNRLLALVLVVMVSAIGCSEKENKEELVFNIQQEGGFAGLSLSKMISVDQPLLETLENQEGNFLSRDILESFDGPGEVTPDSITYNIEVVSGANKSDRYSISESQLSDTQLEFLDTIHELVADKPSN